MADKENDKPPPGFSAFKDLLQKLVKVPKVEIDERERRLKDERREQRLKKRA